MQRLIAFLINKYAFFLFILLEGIALSLVIHYNSYQRSSFVNSISDFSGSVYESWSNATDYFNLKVVNEELAEENALLKTKLKNAYMPVDKNIFTWLDTVYKLQFQYVEAKVINATVNKKKNFFIVNKGNNQGIEPDMGVISPKGIVGIVTEVSANYALIMPVINIDANLAVKLKKNNQRGAVRWDGKNSKTIIMHGVPGYVNCKIGDTIISSGNSLIFPEGIMIGTIKDLSVNKSDFFYNIKVDLAVDFNKINFVYIIRNLLRKEQLELLNKTNDEQNPE